MTEMVPKQAENRRWKARAVRLAQVYKALSEVNQAIVRMSDEQELLAMVCRVAVELGGVRMAWIGMLDREEQRLVPAVSFGLGTDYLENLHIPVRSDLPEGQGPSATAYRESRSVVVNDYLGSSTTAPWREAATRFGWASGGAFPMVRGGETFAVLGVYHGSRNFFDDETVALLDEVVRDIGFALDNFDRDRERRQALEALRTSERHFRAYFERSMVGMAATSPDRGWIEVNQALCNMLGFSREELVRQTWASLTHPEDLPHNEQLFEQMLAGEIDGYSLDKRFLRKDGYVVHVHVAAGAVRDEKGRLDYVVALVEDISARKMAETRDRVRSRALEQVARGAQLQEIMLEVVHGIEADNPAMMCSILLLDEKGEHLLCGAAPSLPEFFNAAIHGEPIGEAAGSCGTAAYTGKRVIVEDIATHPFWRNYRQIAAQAELGSCWSEPIRAATGKILGTFAIYHHHPSQPDAEQIALIENAANLVGIAIQRRRTEDELQLASLIYKRSSEAMVVTSADNKIIAINPAFTRMTGYGFEEVRGKDPGVIGSGRHDAGFFRVMWQDIAQTGLWQGEVWNRRKNGEVFPEWMTINTIRDEFGEVVRYVALGSDITNKLRSDELIWRQANFDFLTDLPNRYMFHDRLEQEVHKAHREGTGFALLFIDLDRFKDINDSLGHQVGDQLLIEAADRISGCARESDTVARLGGDEFTVILTHLSEPEDVERVAQKILLRLQDPFEFRGEVVYISASIGITFYPEDSVDVDQLLSNADQAMYAAKAAGRNCLSYFTPALHASAQRRLKMGNELRRAVEEHQFEIHFQPILDLEGRRVVKAESLIRWRHPERGLVGPAEFIPLAEETGLIVEIGDWVFRESVRWLQRIQTQQGVSMQVSVNISPLQFQSDALDIAGWLAHMKTLDIDPRNLSIEITEGLLLNADPVVTGKLLAFRDAGIEVAIDDFGTGYSALSYLKRFDIDYLKIDQSFVRNLEAGSEDLVLSEAIVMMAHRLGLKVIAEGVETEGQYCLLKNIGCDYGQGFLFSRPLPADRFEQLLQGGGAP